MYQNLASPGDTISRDAKIHPKTTYYWVVWMPGEHCSTPSKCAQGERVKPQDNGRIPEREAGSACPPIIVVHSANLIHERARFNGHSILRVD